MAAQHSVRQDSQTQATTFDDVQLSIQLLQDITAFVFIRDNINKIYFFGVSLTAKPQ